MGGATTQQHYWPDANRPFDLLLLGSFNPPYRRTRKSQIVSYSEPAPSAAAGCALDRAAKRQLVRQGYPWLGGCDSVFVADWLSFFWFHLGGSQMDVRFCKRWTFFLCVCNNPVVVNTYDDM